MKNLPLLLLCLLTLWSPLTLSYPVFKQCDGIWALDQLGTSSETICDAGCLMSSIAMILSDCNRTVDAQDASPRTLNAWLTRNGGYVNENLFIWGAVQKYGLVFQGKIKPSNTEGIAQIKEAFD